MATSFLFCCLLLVSPILVLTEENPYTYAISENAANSTVVEYFPVCMDFIPSMGYVFMDKTTNILMNYTMDCDNGTDESYLLTISTSDHQVAIIDGADTVIISCDEQFDDGLNRTINITVRGVLIGRANLLIRFWTWSKSSFNVSTPDTECIAHVDTFPLIVVRDLNLLDKLFQGFGVTFIVMATIGMGIKTDLAVVKQVLRRPVAPIIGFVAQYTFMPLLSFMFAKLILAEKSALALGLFACGICPGGGASNIYSFLLGGDISLSVTMTTISTLAAFAMVPLWMLTLGRMFMTEEMQINIPYLNICISLSMILIPLLIGFFISYKWPNKTDTIMKFIKPACIITIIFLLSGGMYANRYIFKLFIPEVMLAGAALPYCGYILGGLLALIFRQPWTRIKTIALETGMQNIGVAIFMLLFSFPPPDGDLAAVAPVASACFTPLPPVILVIIYQIYLKWCKKYEKVPDADKDEVKASENGKELVEKLSSV